MQQALSTALKSMAGASDDAWQGLWVTQQAGQLTGAIWVQRLPMKLAQLWLPKAEGPKVDALLSAAHQWVKKQDIRLCHVVLSPEATFSETVLLEHGMQRLACLQHLIGSSDPRLRVKQSASLSLTAFSELSNTEQLALLAAVGHDSLDSRALREILSVEELLAGFYQQDPQAPQHWYAVGYRGVIVGVLLLAPDAASGRWELMLMGLKPEWRGQGLGRALLNKALHLAQQAGASEIILAVDAANLPAKQLYQQAGFKRYTQQRLLAWKSSDDRC